MGLRTKPHKEPYSLVWMRKEDKLQVTKKCNLRFAITSKFMDEVEFDVVPLDICGIVLGSPYLYDTKAIFFREQNQYHLFKEGIKYIVQSHPFKTCRSFVKMEQLKRATYLRKILTLMFVQFKESKCKMEVTKLDFGHKNMFKDSCTTRSVVARSS